MIFYAHKNKKGYYDDIFNHPKSVRMCGDAPIVKLDIQVSESGDYHGWLNNKTGEIDLIFYHFGALQICFPYGYKVEEERGRGKYVRLTVMEID